ncbi:hypothetical protein GQ457_12G015320 [Hibiscus cannabinus]
MQHGWEKFPRHPDEKDLKKISINVTLVKEFYAHFTDPNQGNVYVRTERRRARHKAIRGGARTIAVVRMAELMALIEKTQEQVQDMQEKMTSLFHYMRERDEAIQSYFLELLADEVALLPLFPNEMFHSARPAAPPFNTSVPRPCFKRKANRNFSTADLASEDDVASDVEEDNGSNTTPKETPMTSPPQNKARYKRVASKQTPNDTEVAKGATYEQCKAIAGRSGKVLEPINKQRGITAAQTKTSAVTDTHAKAEKHAKADEDHIDPTDTTEVGSTAETSQPE